MIQVGVSEVCLPHCEGLLYALPYKQLEILKKKCILYMYIIMRLCSLHFLSYDYMYVNISETKEVGGH